MTIRIASRAAIVALALSAALGGTMLAPATASAKGWHGGFKHHGGHWGHGHWGHGRWGHRHGRVGFYAAAYPTTSCAASSIPTATWSCGGAATDRRASPRACPFPE